MSWFDILCKAACEIRGVKCVDLPRTLCAARFVKIRRYGIYNPTFIRNQKLQFVPEEKPNIQDIIKKQKVPETKLERLTRLTGFNPCLCPECKTGQMIRVKQLPPIRAPGLGLFYQNQTIA